MFKRHHNMPIHEVDQLPNERKPIFTGELGRYDAPVGEITVEPVLKKPEIKRDPEGRFERHGKSISKTQKVKKPTIEMNKIAKYDVKADLIKNDNKIKGQRGGFRPGAGRPKGVQNKTTLALKEAILKALDELGGHKYLVTLGIENSSAFAGLLGKVLPSTLAMPESNGGVREKVTFERVIVWPDGHREIDQQVTPLPNQLAPPETVRKTENDEL